MLAKLEQYAAALNAREATRAQHLLVVLPKTERREALRDVPQLERLDAALKRRRAKRRS